MAMGHKASWRIFVATFVVAVGTALIWGFAGGWLITLVENSRPDVYENINVAADGTPVICVALEFVKRDDHVEPPHA